MTNTITATTVNTNYKKINFREILVNCKDIGGDGEIKVIGICDLIEVIYPDFYRNFNKQRIREDAITNLIRKYISNKTIHYYARPKEDFFIWEGIQEAREKGLKIVIVENMS